MGAEGCSGWLRAAILVYLVVTVAATCGMLQKPRLVWSKVLSMFSCTLMVAASWPLLPTLPVVWSVVSGCAIAGTVCCALTHAHAMELQERCCFAASNRAMYQAGDDM